MSNHPRRGWRGRWEFVGRDLRHKPTGLLVNFKRAPDDPTAWDGKPSNLDEVVAELSKSEPIEEVAKSLARLIREAGELFQEARRGND